MVHRQFRPYLRCYVNFVMKNPINGRESKKIIRDVDNFPEFLKSLSWSGEDFIIYTLITFFEDHLCREKGCGKFTYLKCPKCSFPVCSQECNVKSWIAHKEVCETFVNGRNMELMVPKFIHAELESIHGEGILTFEDFFKEFSYKLFETFYNAIQTPAILTLIRSRRNFTSFDCSKLPMLVKKRGAKSPSLQSWRRQISSIYGPDSFLLDKERMNSVAMMIRFKNGDDILDDRIRRIALGEDIDLFADPFN